MLCVVVLYSVWLSEYWLKSERARVGEIEELTVAVSFGERVEERVTVAYFST